MTIQVIPNDLPTLTSGERRVLEKIRSIYKENGEEGYLYIQPRIRNLNPDFILIDPKRGITILEVKDWGISYIKRADRRKVDLADNKKVDNPMFKANQYFNAASGLFSMQEILLDDDGTLKFNLSSMVIFPNIKTSELDDNELEEVFNQPPSRYISGDILSSIKVEQFFSDMCAMESEEINEVRTILFPEIKITRASNEPVGEFNSTDIIKALDAEQERFAKRLPYGHYMVTGIPGSGKTILLLARAIHLVREHPDWKIRILTYNKSLKTKIENKINALAEELAFMEIRLENIQVHTFHKFALDIANVGVPQKPSGQWWSEELPQLALQRVTPMYDAILVDEYQDFLDDWIRLCVKACKEYTYTNNSKEEVTGINLFLAGDRLQSIYNSADHSWKSLGIDMRGRSSLLNKSYRSGDEHINLALNFLKKDKRLEDEVNKFYSPMSEMSFENMTKDSVIFIKDAYEGIAEAVHNLIYQVGYKPEDILILCKKRRDCDRIKKHFNEELRRKTEVGKNITEGRLVMTTYHSSKGLEAPIVFLVDVDSFETQQLAQNDMKFRKLLYVGMTRPSERLYIHESTENKDAYGQIIRDIWEQDRSVKMN